MPPEVSKNLTWLVEDSGDSLKRRHWRRCVRRKRRQRHKAQTKQTQSRNCYDYSCDDASRHYFRNAGYQNQYTKHEQNDRRNPQVGGSTRSRFWSRRRRWCMKLSCVRITHRLILLSKRTGRKACRPYEDNGASASVHTEFCTLLFRF